jgi:hypothetical protein
MSLERNFSRYETGQRYLTFIICEQEILDRSVAWGWQLPLNSVVIFVLKIATLGHLYDVCVL